MIGALIKGAGRVLSTAGKGFKSIKGRLKSFNFKSITDRFKKSKLVNKASDKMIDNKIKKLSSPKDNQFNPKDLKKSDTNINRSSVFKKLVSQIPAHRESQAATRNHLAKEFNLSSEELRILTSYPDNNPEEINIDTDPNPSLGSEVIKSLPYDKSKSYRILSKEDGDHLTLTTPEENSAISDIIDSDQSESIMKDLNRNLDPDEVVELSGGEMTLRELNQVNQNLINNRYVFLSSITPIQNAIYKLSQNDVTNSKLLGVLAHYLLYRNGSNYEEHLNEVSSKLVKIDSYQSAQNLLLSNLSENLNESKSEIAEIIDESHDDLSNRVGSTNSQIIDIAESQSAEIESNNESTQSMIESSKFDLLGIINSGFSKVKGLISNHFEYLVLLMLLVDQIWSKIKDYFEGLSLEGIGNLIWSNLKKWGSNLVELMRFLYWEIMPTSMGGKDGKLVWNGGDYYFKYDKPQADGTMYEYSSHTDNNEKVVRKYDEKGKLVSAEINDTEYKSDGSIKTESDEFGSDHYNIVAGENGVESITPNASWWGENAVPVKSPTWMVGTIIPTNLNVGGSKVYRIGGPNTVYASHLYSLDDSTYENNWDKSNSSSYVYIYKNENGYWVATPKTDRKDTCSEVSNLFNNLYNGKNTLENDVPYTSSDPSSIITTGFGGSMQSTIWNALKVLDKYKNSTVNDIKSVTDQLGGNIKVNKDGTLDTSTAKDVSQMTVLVDENGGISTIGQSMDNAAKSLSEHSIKYSQDLKKRNEIFNDGNSADCSSYITYLLSTAGVNLRSVYGGTPSTLNFKNYITKGGDKLDRSVVAKYGVITVDRKGKDGKPDESKLSKGDIAVFRDNTGGHVMMYIGNHQWTHQGLSGNSYGFSLNTQNWKKWTGGRNYVGSIRFTKSSTKDIYGSTDAENTKFTEVGDSWNPEMQGPEGSNGVKLEDRDHNDYRGTRGNVCERSNNPGNIRGTSKGSSIRKYPGWVGITKSKSGDFSTFENQMYGIYAFYRLIATQYLPKGQNTIKSILYKYCPPGDHGQGDPINYINHVSKSTGIDKDEVIRRPEKNLFQSLMKSVYQFEGGTKSHPMDQKDLDEAWNLFSMHYSNHQWPVVPTVEPKVYGTNAVGTSRVATPDENEMIIRRIFSRAEGLGRHPNRKDEEVTILAQANIVTETTNSMPSVDMNVEENPEYFSKNDKVASNENVSKDSKDSKSTPTLTPAPNIINNHQHIHAPKSPDQFRIDKDAYLNDNNLA